MPKNCCSKALIGQDELGKTTTLTYRSEQIYGTALGGCCSISANLFILAFFLVEITSLMFDP